VLCAPPIRDTRRAKMLVPYRSGHGDGPSGFENDDGARLAAARLRRVRPDCWVHERVPASWASIIGCVTKTMATLAVLAKAAAAALSVPGLNSLWHWALLGGDFPKRLHGGRGVERLDPRQSVRVWDRSHCRRARRPERSLRQRGRLRRRVRR